MNKQLSKYGDLGVDIKLAHTQNTPHVYWSPRGEDGYGGFNSYVIVENPEHGQFLFNGKRVSLLSINGVGEIRWSVADYDVKYALEKEKEGKLNSSTKEELLAMRYFGLELISDE